MAVETRLREVLRTGDLPFSAGCRGSSPSPREYRDVASGVLEAVFDGSADLASGWKTWRDSLGEVRYQRFYCLPGDLIRYDIRGRHGGRLEHRVGLWKYSWNNGRLTRLEPVSETLTVAARPWFQDITAFAFAGERSFHEQLARGVPYWRGRLDPACGIDLYGENGIAAADIDGDGHR